MLDVVSHLNGDGIRLCLERYAIDDDVVDGICASWEEVVLKLDPLSDPVREHAITTAHLIHILVAYDVDDSAVQELAEAELPVSSWETARQSISIGAAIDIARVLLWGGENRAPFTRAFGTSVRAQGSAIAVLRDVLLS